MADSFNTRVACWWCRDPMKTTTQHHAVVSADRAHRSDLLELANAGAAVAGHLSRVGVTERRQLIGRDPLELFRQLCAAAERPYDPCLLEPFMSVVDQAEGGPARPWRHDTPPQRKRMLAEGAPA
jgi:hypothetical protein